MTIKAFLFDLDGTLRHSQPLSGEVCSDFAQEMGLPLTQEDRIRAARWEHYYWASSPELHEDLPLWGEDDADPFWAKYCERRLLAMGASEERARRLAVPLRDAMRERYHPEEWTPPELPEVLTSLQERGYQLGVLSNRTSNFDSVLEKIGLLGYFEFRMAAGEVEALKPDPRVFAAALERLRLAPEEAVYIGDNYYADALGARAAGMNPILYDPRGLFPDAECPVIRSFVELLQYP